MPFFKLKTEETLLLDEEVICTNLMRADTSPTRIRGLLGRKSLDKEEGLWIKPCNSIHMFFMRFAIDVVFLDENLQVVSIAEGLRPWRLARGGKFAKSVLELPTGKISFFNIRVGSRLTIRSKNPSTESISS